VAKAGGPWELYNIDADPVELADQAAAMPEKVREMAARWDDWAAKNQVTPYPGSKK
jgi:arylsulfatase